MEVNKPWNSDGGSKLFINAERREKTHRYCVSPIFVARHDCKPFKSSACRKCCDRARSLGISRHGASPPPHTEESTAWCDTNTLHHRTVCSQVSASLYPFKFRINVRSVYFMFSKVSRMTQVLASSCDVENETGKGEDLRMQSPFHIWASRAFRLHHGQYTRKIPTFPTGHSRKTCDSLSRALTFPFSTFSSQSHPTNL
jgi:hypothetical protein